MTESTSARAISASDIAEALGLQQPTEQQQRVIEAPLAPALVVAGAGSGKTETMANRVLWLLANGHVSAGQILGLTFTRKAAGELAERIRERIGQLADKGLVHGEFDAFDPPQISTYNSFANTIFTDNAVLLGRESDGALLGEASAWQLARATVVRSSDPRIGALDRSVDTITKAVLSISHALGENVSDPEAVRAFATEFAAVADLPAGGRGEYADVATLAATVGGLDVLVQLAEQFTEAKIRRGAVEYSDQVGLALRLVRSTPRIRDDFRDRYRVVLLDEYQDTSVVQTWLLAELFAAHPVMAVGDPNQSIYGWRGASSANLEQFATQFGAAKGERFSLSTSWRNGHRILEVANAIVDPLREGTVVHVDRLEAGLKATSNPVEVRFEETIADEADAVAVWLKQRLAERTPKGEIPSAAMLFRARSTQRWFTRALREHGVPFHLLGIGGLLGEPEIADLVSALAVTHDPSAGSELLRLLAGSRWRLGVRDLHALGRVASWLRSRDYAQQPLSAEVNERLRASVAAGETGSIVDALDFVAHARESHTQLAGFSEVGLARLREAGAFFARLRARSGLDLLDFVTVVEQELQLDIEVAANENRPANRESFEAFYDAIGDYLSIAENAHLGGFLGWLREADRRDGLAPRPEDPEPGTVQLMTIHGSKGLERDVIVVPRFVEKELPGTPAEGSTGWLSFGRLPYEFRGDGDSLPQFAWRTAATRKDLLDAKKAFSDEVKAHHEREERRLAYVAVTRARHSLLITGSFWATQTAQRAPSSFLLPLVEAIILPPFPPASEALVNPMGAEAATIVWPADPLGERRQSVEAAAELVLSADPDARGRWGAELDLLLTERRLRLEGDQLVPMPDRIPASRFKDFVSSPAAVAASLRRPMPEKPYRATRLGTLFHSWVEQRYGVGGTTETIDALAIELDDDMTWAPDAAAAEADKLAELTATFERSEWAALRPVDVEIEIHLPLAGQVVICKIDAVFERDGRFQVVDWKTGKAPRDADDLEQKQLQLALYRLAYARFRGIDPDLIDAVFYFVADDTVVVPERIFDEAELIELWGRATAAE